MSFSRPALVDLFADRVPFGLVPRTGVHENDFFYAFYIFHNTKVARPGYKKVQLVEDFRNVLFLQICNMNE
jgi:hypothetical protein